MVPELRNLEYTDRLKAMKLPSMYYRRDRGDMIECYKFTHNLYKSQSPFEMEGGHNTRTHSLKFKKHHLHSAVRRHFFSERAVNHWNALPKEVVHAPTLNTFKNRLDKHWQAYYYNLEPVPTRRMLYTHEDSEDDEDVQTVLQA